MVLKARSSVCPKKQWVSLRGQSEDTKTRDKNIRAWLEGKKGVSACHRATAAGKAIGGGVVKNRFFKKGRREVEKRSSGIGTIKEKTISQGTGA